MKHVLVLGAGFAGLELATCLSESLAGEIHTTLIDQNDAFTFGFSKLDVLFGRGKAHCGTVAVTTPLASAGPSRQVR